MKKILITCLLISSLFLWPEGLFNNPESVTYEPTSECYLVSDYGNGSIIKIDNENEQSYFMTGLNENLGILLLENILYISCEDSLLVYDIQSGTCSAVHIPALYWLDGMTSDSEGNIYMVDCSGRVFKVYTEQLNYELYVEGLPAYTQDLVYDQLNNRLLIVAWQNNSPIYAVDLDDPLHQVYEAVSTDTGYFDGITADPQGNLYLSSHADGGIVLRYNNDLTQPPSLIPGSFSEPAGLYFNSYTNILAVPDFAAATVHFIEIDLGNSENLPAPDNYLPCFNAPNPFNPSTAFYFQLDRPARVLLEIFNLKGQLIKKIDYYSQKAGINSIVWNVDQEYSLPAATYLYRIKSGTKSANGKMTMLK